MLAALLVALTLTSPAPAPKIVTKADNGTTVTIARNQMLKIRLDECRGSCGYRWETIVKPDPTILKRRSISHWEQPCPTPDPANPTQPVPCPVGRPEIMTVRYTGVKAGRTTLRLGNFGPGTDHKLGDTFRLTVRVR